MQTRDIPAVSLAITPKAWPPVPTHMTFSKLQEIETCPRRWALASAEYPGIWDRRGYPTKFLPSGLIGHVVHLSLKTITLALARSGCLSVQDPSAIAVLKELGGYSQIINDCIQRIFSEESKNPRIEQAREYLMQSVRSQVSEIRERVQVLLARIRFEPASGVKQSGGNRPLHRTALGLGSHPEVELRAPKLGWVGIADLINLSDACCEIVDFKTGEQNRGHPFQLRVYGLLWARDAELNPRARHAGKLTLSYRNADVDVEPPSSGDLDALERELRNRTQAAVKTLTSHPPEARPSLEACRYCSVRHLCGEYWTMSVQTRLAQEDQAKTEFVDLQVQITNRHGPLSWDAIVEVSAPFVTKRIVLRTTSNEPNLQIGDRIRVLGAHLTVDSEDGTQPAMATTSILSEIFIVSNE